jgi:hypothetical protein
MHVNLESNLYNSSYVLFVPLPGSDRTVVGPRFTVSGWFIEAAKLLQEDNYYPAFEQTYSRVSLVVLLRRDAGFYFSRLITNIMLISAWGVQGAAVLVWPNPEALAHSPYHLAHAAAIIAFLSLSMRPDFPERSLAVIACFT